MVSRRCGARKAPVSRPRRTPALAGFCSRGGGGPGGSGPSDAVPKERPVSSFQGRLYARACFPLIMPPLPIALLGWHFSVLGSDSPGERAGALGGAEPPAGQETLRAPGPPARLLHSGGSALEKRRRDSRGGGEGGGKMTFPRNSWSRGGWGAGSEPRPRPLREGPGLGLVPPTACLRWRPPPLPLTSLAALEKHPHCRHGNRGWRRLRQEPAERRCRPLPRAGDASLPPSPLLAPSPPESAFPCGGTAGGGAAGKKGQRGKRRRGGELVLAAPPSLPTHGPGGSLRPALCESGFDFTPSHGGGHGFRSMGRMPFLQKESEVRWRSLVGTSSLWGRRRRFLPCPGVPLGKGRPHSRAGDWISPPSSRTFHGLLPLAIWGLFCPLPLPLPPQPLRAPVQALCPSPQLVPSRGFAAAGKREGPSQVRSRCPPPPLGCSAQTFSPGNS